MCDFAHVDYDWLPGDGGVIQGLHFNRRVQRLKAGRLPLTYPLRDELDEYPLVPFLFADDGSNLYDSTAIAHWLDHHHGTDSRRLIPHRPACELIARLIDDHFDEFGLYVAHHHRWVTSAKRSTARSISSKACSGRDRFYLAAGSRWRTQASMVSWG